MPEDSIINYPLANAGANEPLPLYLQINGQQHKLADDVKHDLNIDPYNDPNTKLFLTHVAAEQSDANVSTMTENSSQVIFLQITPNASDDELPNDDHDVSALTATQLQWVVSQVAGMNSEIPQALKDVVTTINTAEKRAFLRDLMYGGKFRVQAANDKLYVIFRGKDMSKVKNILGTRYRIDNQKIQSIRMAANTQGAVSGSAEALCELAADGAKEGVLYFVVAGAMDIVKYYTDKKHDVASLLAHLAVDAVIGVPVVLAGMAVAALFAFIGAPVLLVIVAAISVSIYTSSKLDGLSEKYQLTEHFSEKIKKGINFMKSSSQLERMQKENAGFLENFLAPSHKLKMLN